MFLPYYPKENALCELTQLYSFTGLHIVHKVTKNSVQQKTTLLPKSSDITQ